MCGRFVYGGLLISSLAMLLFLAGFVCLQLGFGLLMGLFYLVASKVLLLALALLASLGVIALCKAIGRELAAYFNRESVVVRRLRALQIRQQDVEQRKALEWRQLHYLNKFKRQRLLAADNRKQSLELADAIDVELREARALLPNTTYKDLRKRLRKCRKRADALSMLALRQQLPCP